MVSSSRRAPALALIAALAACAAPALTACSLIYGLSGFAGGAEDPLDGPAPDDGAGGDALDAREASATDALADVGAAKRCAPAPAGADLCDDFDRTSPLGAWGKVREEDGGRVSVASDGDGTYLHTSLPAIPGLARACLELHVVKPVMKRIHWAFRIRVPVAPAQSVQVMTFAVGTAAANTAGMGFTVTPTKTYLYEQTFGPGGAYKDVVLDRFIGIGAFHDVDVVVALDATPTRVVVMIDGSLALTYDKTLPFGPSQASFFQAGATYATPSPDVVVDVDGVLIETE